MVPRGVGRKSIDVGWFGEWSGVEVFASEPVAVAHEREDFGVVKQLELGSESGEATGRGPKAIVAAGRSAATARPSSTR
jgi:hypothetical protein